MAPGGAVVMIQTHWDQDDLAGRILREHADENWHVTSGQTFHPINENAPVY
jgi:hypothetical protein